MTINIHQLCLCLRLHIREGIRHLLRCHQTHLHQHISKGLHHRLRRSRHRLHQHLGKDFTPNFGELNTADANISARYFSTYCSVINYALTNTSSRALPSTLASTRRLDNIFARSFSNDFGIIDNSFANFSARGFANDFIVINNS